MLQLYEAVKSDLPAMVELSRMKRLDYEKAQPQFWCYAERAEEVQLKWFEELLSKDDYLIFVARQQDNIIGFVIGRLLHAPEVYDPGGLTLMVDDFCIGTQDNWESVGGSLIQELQIAAKAKGAAQIVVVCGAHDEAKRKFLKNIGLQIASEWYIGAIGN